MEDNSNDMEEVSSVHQPNVQTVTRSIARDRPRRNPRPIRRLLLDVSDDRNRYEEVDQKTIEQFDAEFDVILGPEDSDLDNIESDVDDNVECLDDECLDDEFVICNLDSSIYASNDRDYTTEPDTTDDEDIHSDEEFDSDDEEVISGIVTKQWNHEATPVSMSDEEAKDITPDEEAKDITSPQCFAYSASLPLPTDPLWPDNHIYLSHPLPSTLSPSHPASYSMGDHMVE